MMRASDYIDLIITQMVVSFKVSVCVSALILGLFVEYSAMSDECYGIFSDDLYEITSFFGNISLSVDSTHPSVTTSIQL